MCKHYWQLEGQHGRASQGICKYCGAKREFLNSFPDNLDVGATFTIPNRMYIPENNVDKILTSARYGIRTQRMLIDSI